MPRSGPPDQPKRPRRSSTRERAAESSFKRKALSLAIFLILAASVLNALLGERGFLGLARARSAELDLEAEVLALREDNGRLGAEIEALRTEPEAIERRAREVLGMIRPGELVLIVQEPD